MKTFHFTKFIILLLFTFLIKDAFCQVSLSVEANRTMGVAPLYVFFDATASAGLADTNALINADFSWDFDYNLTDSTTQHRYTKGLVAGHVYENPGQYLVQCIVTSQSGDIDTNYTSIAVRSFEGTTYYVSDDGSDNNDGLSELQPFQTPSVAVDLLADSSRILLCRGDTFMDVDLDIQNFNTGAIVIGSYGIGRAPIISGIPGRDIISIDNCDEVVIMELQIGLNNFSYNRGISCEESQNVLAHRLEIIGSNAMASYQDDSDGFCMSQSYIHNTGVMAIFSGDGTRFSWIGNRVDSLLGSRQPEHAIRIQGGEKQYIAHSIFTNLIDTKTAITIRGDGQRHVVVYDNVLDRILEINPTNSNTLQAISTVTIEGNYIGQNFNYVGSIRNPTTNGINIEATNIAVRNNIIDGYTNAINISHDYNGVISGMVDVYHNTVNWRQVSPQSGNAGRIVRIRDVSRVNIYNNLIYGEDINHIQIVNNNLGSSEIVVDGNLLLHTPQKIQNIRSSSAHLHQLDNYRIDGISVGVNSALDTFTTVYDIAQNTRPMGSSNDIGALEYICDGITSLIIAPTTFKKYETIDHIQLIGVLSDSLSLKSQQIRILPNTEILNNSHFVANVGDCTSSE